MDDIDNFVIPSSIMVLDEILNRGSGLWKIVLVAFDYKKVDTSTCDIS
jgi:hypothetical protein